MVMRLCDGARLTGGVTGQSEEIPNGARRYILSGLSPGPSVRLKEDG